MEAGILNTLLKQHYWYNIHNIHNCVLMGWPQTIVTIPLCMCSTAMASPCVC